MSMAKKSRSAIQATHPLPRSRFRTQHRNSDFTPMLRRKQGATIATTRETTDWQPHSVRGFLTAVVRNKLGLALISERIGEERVYRIVANDIPPKRKGRPGSKVATGMPRLSVDRAAIEAEINRLRSLGVDSFAPCGARPSGRPRRRARDLFVFLSAVEFRFLRLIVRFARASSPPACSISTGRSIQFSLTGRPIT